MTEQITVRGYVATDPESRTLPDGTVVVTFRLASTPRWFDQQSQNWRDGHTNWLTVQAFRTLGLNALASIRKGQPVVVIGRLKVRFWDGEHGRNTAVDVDAVSIGHDLALGTACFQSTVSSAPPAEQTAEQTGSPSSAPAEEGAEGPPAGEAPGPRARRTGPSPTPSTRGPASSSGLPRTRDGARGSSRPPREPPRPGTAPTRRGRGPAGSSCGPAPSPPVGRDGAG
ncbi:single-stranded DNA-binding protein [Kocuria rosea]|uniref:single-stranded DNA-binding protein n=1 Tax=Kocuria rosea TaxID=1275 RepID=UPI00203E089F|nr:single-stranded DNA-binding protein [Kocuria rosea]MCM3689326.1 single-stranded DNA-binding protein [Kocuria rosea]